MLVTYAGIHLNQERLKKIILNALLDIDSLTFNIEGSDVDIHFHGVTTIPLKEIIDLIPEGAQR